MSLCAENVNLRYDQQGLDLTEHSEDAGGPHLKSYWDPTGKCWTCGYGHTKDVTAQTTCTPELADTWLASDVAWAVYVVKAYVAVPLSQEQFDALVDFVFNVGSENFIHSTLLEDINSNNYGGALDQFGLWDKSGGIPLAGLRSRRGAEKALFALGTNFSASSSNP